MRVIFVFNLYIYDFLLLYLNRKIYVNKNNVFISDIIYYAI